MSKTIAGEAERVRRRQLEKNYNGIKKPEPPKLFSAAAEEYIAFCRSEQLAHATMQIHERGVKNLLPLVGKKLLSDITLFDIKRMVDWHLNQGHSNRYANMTVATLRSILHRNNQWERLRPFYRKLPERKDAGKELSHTDEARLLEESRKSLSRGLALKVVLGIYSGMRSDEIASLQWRQIDLSKAYLTVGKSKTKHGEGRIIPLIGPALRELTEWSKLFPNRLPDHYVFPSEKYAYTRKKKTARIYNHDPKKRMGSCKKAWERSKKRAGVRLRFHDLRHTTVTRLLDAGCTLEQIAPILGWSGSTMAEMMHRYQHRSLEKRRQTLSALLPPNTPSKDEKRAKRDKRAPSNAE